MTTVEITAPVGGDTRLLALRVTPEQEIAIYAFFQINGWTIVTEEIAKKCENCGIGINGGDDPPTCHICQKAIENAEALLDETNEEENGEMSDTGNAMTVAKQAAPPPPVKTEIVTTNSVGTETRVPQSVAPKIYNVNNSAENRPYKCEHCGKHFRKKSHVVAHNLDVHMCVHSDDLPKYKRKLLMKKKLMEEIEAESNQSFDNSNIETDIITEETIAEVETHIHEAEQAGQIIQVQNVEDHHIKEEQVAEVVTDGQDENSIANSLLTLVEMITSSNQDAHTTTSANGNSHVDLSNVQIDDPSQRQNIIITTSDGTQIQQQDTVMEDGSMQEVKTIFVDEHGREIGTSNENVVITSMGDTQVTTEQVIDSVTGQYVDGNTYVMEVEYVEQQ
ncbi:KRAB [Mytilus edulis]|uniref:KRAB n=1 Tax=Mytilus edulis TaxID=6550 RepID=A0A8S3TQZ4_MYTED|nr:KRAB [Mytilus edulis]